MFSTNFTVPSLTTGTNSKSSILIPSPVIMHSSFPARAKGAIALSKVFHAIRPILQECSGTGFGTVTVLVYLKPIVIDGIMVVCVRV